MRPSQIVARALATLTVPQSAMDAAIEIAAKSGYKEADAVQRMHREWINDMVSMVGKAPYHAASRDPGKTFLAWMAQRVVHPHHVSHRTVDAIRAEHGEETALLFSELRWTQEVAWAFRMRGSDNDRIVFLAELWLGASRRDPGKLFRGIVEIYASEAALDSSYREATVHMLAEDEILDSGGGESYWRPLWLRFAEKEFGHMVNNIPRQRLVALAARSREAEFVERTQRVRVKQVQHLRTWRLSLIIGVLAEAVRQGLSSDDVLAAERGFIDDVGRGVIDLASQETPPWRMFMQTLPRWSESSPAPDEGERARRISALQSLPPSWTDRLPEDIRCLGASDYSRMLSWFDDVASPSGGRVPPEDASVDFAMWLLETAS